MAPLVTRRSTGLLQVPLLASYASATESLADPAGSSVLVAAVWWLQATLLGTVATTVAIIAVAWAGLMILAGRASLRYGLTVIAGCFVLFGASTIAAGIEASLAGAAPGAELDERPPAPPLPDLPPPPPANRDPYAGASMPSG